MNKFLKGIAYLTACLTLSLSVSASLVGCNLSDTQDTTSNEGTDIVETTPPGSDSENVTESDKNEETQPDETPDGKVEYTVKVTTIGGRSIPKLNFYVYVEDDLITYGQTDENGVGTVKLDAGKNYTVELSASSLEGYIVEGRYTFENNMADIVLTSAVIEDSDLTGVTYSLGDIMRDFTVTTTDGTVFKLSEVLKEKKGVLINFWYSTCSPCINEFPYLQSAYEQFQDDIEVIALNNYAGDSDNTVKEFKANMGLTFPVAKDYSTLGSAFKLQGYPTSIFVDRYGTICLIEIGGLTSEKPFVATFRHFASDNYVQKLLTGGMEELTPTAIPDVEMPSSEDVKDAFAPSLNVSFYPEKDTDDAMYSWPFLIGDLNGTKCIYPSNSFKDSSFATLHADVELKKGEALAFDWFANTETGADMLFVLVDGKDIYRLSGISTEFATCYPYVATKDGTYKVSFIYVKDDTTDAELDVIYLKNFRKVDASAVDVPTYIPRQAATDKNANGLGFASYITPVFNENDGYFHVGSADGPLLLANLMDKTQLSETSLNIHGYNGELTDSRGNVYTDLEKYCNYSINGTLYGFSPVTLELRALLERAAEMLGFEPGNPNQWLQACSYYDAYGTYKQLEDPVKGVAFFAAYDTVMSTPDDIKYNTVTYDGRVIMPRGLKYKFVPSKSGAYLIKSQSEEEVNGWIFNENGDIIHTAATVDRPYGGIVLDTGNVSMIEYLEAGKTYYIDIAYYDIYAAGTFTFTVEYIAESYQHFHLASPGYFTYQESTSGQINETVAGGIDVKLGDDGYYHEILADGSLGSVVYADFIYSTGLYSHSIKAMIGLGGFNFSLSETDQIVLAKLKELGGDKEATLAYYKSLWGDSYAEREAIYQLEEVLADKFHGEGEDYTEAITAYLDKLLTASDAPELEGCVPVDAELAKLLQALMDKYSFSGVKNSWTKLCYYYKSVGSTNN